MENPPSPTALQPRRDLAWLRERVVVDGSSLAVERAAPWAEALGVELVQVPRTFRPATVPARLVVVEAAGGHVRGRVRHAAAPLLVARPPAPGGHILVATDFGDPAEHALDLVAPFVQRRPSRLTLVHSIEPGVSAAEWMANFGGSDAAFVPDDAESLRQATRARLQDVLDRHGLSGDVAVANRPAAGLIVELAQQLGADLVVVGAGRLRGPLQWLRHSVAVDVAAAAPCSVLVVPHRPHPHPPG